jgi:uncharacterized protein (TIGR02271 family)
MTHSEPTEQVVVVDSEGVRGTAPADVVQQPGSHVLMTFDGNRRVQIPVEMLHRREDGSYFLPLSLRELNEGIVRLERTGSSSQGQGEIVAVLPVIVEEAQIAKRQVETGSVRIHKQVQIVEETVDVPLVRDRVQVERVPIDRFLERPAEAHYRGDTLVIPVMEEIVVVQKRLRLREEIHVTTVREQVRHQELVPLQREQVSITRRQAGQDEGPSA